MSHETSDHYFNTGQSHLSAGRISEALEAFKNSINLDPKNVSCHVVLFQLYQQLNMQEEAVTSLQRAAHLEPTVLDANSHLALAEALVGYGRRVEAIERYLTVITQEPSNEAATIKLAECLRLEGKLRDAVTAYDRLLIAKPSLGTFVNTLHISCSIPGKSEQLKQQIRNLQCEFANVSDLFLTHSEEVDERFRQGLREGSDGAWSKALSTFENVVQSAPQCHAALFNLGILHFAIGSVSGEVEQFNKALHYLSRSLEVTTTHAPTYRTLGRVLLAIYGSNEEALVQALACFERAISLAPNDPQTYMVIAELFQRSGKFYESLPYLRKFREAFDKQITESPYATLGLRFLSSDNTYAMGHLAFLPECYIKMQQLGWIENAKPVILAPVGLTANPCLLDYWKKHFTIITDSDQIEHLSPLARQLHEDTSYLKTPGGKVLNAHIARSYIQKEWEDQNRGPLLSLTEEHRERGYAALEKLGMPRDAWFVSLHAREGGFKREGSSLYNAHRNVEIASFYDAMGAITRAGGWVLRLGEPSSQEIPLMPNVIDYAHSEFKSDWMDVFLAASCRFYLGGGGGGLFCTAMTFGVPYIGTNLPLTPLREGKNEIFLPKLLWNIRENRHVTFKEMFSAPLFQCEVGENLSQWGLRAIDNSSEEIAETVIEALERKNGIQKYSPEDEALQERYRSFLSQEAGVFTSRIGRFFLRKYAHLLE